MIVHGVLAVLTLGLWLLVPVAILTWRRGGGLRKVSYGLWGVIAVLVVSLGASFVSDDASEIKPTYAGEGAAPTKQAKAPSSKGPASTATVTSTITQQPTATTVSSAAAKPPKPKTYLVAEVADGDTIKLANGKRVRLVQIDTPELSGSECYADEARATLVRLLPPGTPVRLEFDAKLDKVDQYDRQLAYVFKGRESINHTLVLRGAASVWFYQGAKGKYATKLDTAARQARANKRGLWAACAATEYDPFNGVQTRKPAPPPPPPPPPAAAPEPAAPAQNCHPSYEGACLDPNASDYDCAGGSGNGPEYTGAVKVVGSDEYGLDRDGDGYACEG